MNVSSPRSGPDLHQARTPAQKRRGFSFLLLVPGQGVGAPPARGEGCGEPDVDDPIARFKALTAEIRRSAPPAPSPASRRKAKRIAKDILARKQKR